MAMVCMNGQMEGSLKETGKTIKWTAEEFLIGLIKEGTKENMLMIKKKAKGISYGQTEGSTRAAGLMESSMVKEFT